MQEGRADRVIVIEHGFVDDSCDWVEVMAARL